MKSSGLYDKSLMAAALAAIMISGCTDGQVTAIDFLHTPVQVVFDMNVLQSDNGSATMRMSAPKMERYQYVVDSAEQSYELYPEGFLVNAYTRDGQLETTITSLQAKHITNEGSETWCAYGDVLVTNHIKGETIASDTMYWNRAEKRIYTDCYVVLTSPSGMMQGYGLTSDERANNSTILRPYDSFTVLRDSTSAPYIDTLNMLGPK